MRFVLVLLMILPAPVAALEICDDLWFTRNLTFHRAGYCFGSVLGKAVFGNAGCNAAGMSLAPEEAALVTRLRALEAEWQCDVDTSQDFLSVSMVEARKTLVDVPVATGYESGCIGWKGERLPLRTERNADGLLTGAARKGDTLLFQFEDVDGWSFVEVLQNGVPAGLGWAKVKLNEANCEMLAG